MGWAIFETKVDRIGTLESHDIVYIKHEECGGLHAVLAKPGDGVPLPRDDFRTEAVRQHLDGKLCSCEVDDGPVIVRIEQPS